MIKGELKKDWHNESLKRVGKIWRDGYQHIKCENCNTSCHSQVTINLHKVKLYESFYEVII